MRFAEPFDITCQSNERGDASQNCRESVPEDTVIRLVTLEKVEI